MAVVTATSNYKKATHPAAAADGPVVLRLSLNDSSGSPGQRLVIRLPEWRVLRIVARSVLVALALVSLPWLGLGNNAAATGNAATADQLHEAVWTQNQHQPQPVDDVFFLPMLLRDLKRNGIFQPNGRAVYLGANAHLRIPFLRRNAVEPITDETAVSSVADGSVAFLLAAEGVRDAGTAAFVDRLVKVGGVVAVRLGDDPASAFPLPANYMLTYVRRFGGSTIVAMKKTAAAAAAVHAATATGRRKLLTIPAASKKEALNGLEDVLLEPPRGSSRSASNKYLKRTRYLPDLTGDTLDGYPRLVFVDVGPGHRGGGNRWFEKHYPTRNRQFELIRVETEEDGSMVDPPPREDKDEWMEPEEDGVSSWLRANVGEEDYVVMKAEAEVVEVLIRSRAIGLVDELFFGCSNRWQKSAGRKMGASRRAYWECLALYGKLRDEGVAVHQWWG